MSNEIRLQSRDIELLVFLGKYKIMSLDNTRYIYDTITYQEKRMVGLVKHNYIKRLKHRYITLGYSRISSFLRSMPEIVVKGNAVSLKDAAAKAKAKK